MTRTFAAERRPRTTPAARTAPAAVRREFPRDGGCGVGLPLFLRGTGGTAHVQTKRALDRSSDPAERHAEQVATGVTAGRSMALSDLTHRADPPNVGVTAVLGTGRYLDSGLRPPLERRFAQGFGDVRIHTGPDADALARMLGARAFTTGSDIVFADGEYAPGTVAGRRLLAHELTHVAQQRSGGDVPPVQRFVSTEHEQLGDVTNIRAIDLGNGVVLSWGQIVALAGDYYGSLDDLRADAVTEAGRRRIRAALEHASLPSVATTSLPAPSPDDRAATAARYATLALTNVPHFLSGGTAIETWRAYHHAAIVTAVQAGLANDPALRNAAFGQEAFGQHFLTDAFSGGHVRTPRQAIADWYATWGRTAGNQVLDCCYNRLLAGLTAQAAGQVPGWVPNTSIAAEVRPDLDAGWATFLSGFGGRGAVVEQFGQAVGGAISGAIHDLEGRRGVAVWSLARPGGWTTVGDARLTETTSDASATRHEAELAVLHGHQDVERAFSIGQAEGRTRNIVPEPSALTNRVFFGFDRDDVSAVAVDPLRRAGAYILYHPGTRVELVGHADERGDESYNAALGERRALNVAAIVESVGVDPDQITVRSEGESMPAGGRPRPYWRNRRVELIWSQGDSGAAAPTNQSVDIAFNRALARAEAEIGPPYRSEDFVPQLQVGANPDLPDWHWGSLPADFRGEVAAFALRYAGVARPAAAAALAGPALDPRTRVVSILGTDYTVTVEPRPIATRLVDDLFADPLAFLEGCLGQRAGPVAPVDAGLGSLPGGLPPEPDAGTTKPRDAGAQPATTP